MKRPSFFRAAALTGILFLVVGFAILGKNILFPESIAGEPRQSQEARLALSTESEILQDDHPNSITPGAGYPIQELDLQPAGVITYTVEAGDTLSSIADRFNLQAETIVWANEGILQDNPHRLKSGQNLVIPPLDGIFYRWKTGDDLAEIATRYGIEPEEIINFPGNQIDQSGDIESGKLLFLPGGHPPAVIIPNWSSIGITRENPIIGDQLGPGFCEHSTSGPIGTEQFQWPIPADQIIDLEVSDHYLGIITSSGAEVSSAEQGVILFAGALKDNRGNYVIIDHGNGWQTFYGPLETLSVECGDIVRSGDEVGLMDSKDLWGGQYLLFQMFKESIVDPLQYLSPLEISR